MYGAFMIKTSARVSAIRCRCMHGMHLASVGMHVCMCVSCLGCACAHVCVVQCEVCVRGCMCQNCALKIDQVPLLCELP